MFWDTLRADVRFAIRQALQAPLYTGLAVAALALGIGANSAIFTVVQGILLKPLPYQDPGQLVMVWSHNTKEEKPENPISPANFRDLRDESAGVHRARELLLLRHQHPARRRRAARDDRHLVCRAWALRACSAARRCSAGRLQDGDPAGALVLSHGYWQRRFGGDPGLIGKTMAIDDQPATIVGVMPPDFVFPYRGMVGPTGFTRTMAVDAWTHDAPHRAADGRPVGSADPERPLPGRGRPADAGHERRAGPRRHGGHRLAARAGVSRHQRRLDDHRHPAARTGGRPGAPGAAGAAGRRRRDPADGLRERRQPGAGAQRQPAEGAGGALRARRQPRPPRPAGAHREPAARGRPAAWSACWWCAGACRG